jgi:hypothetical protein
MEGFKECVKSYKDVDDKIKEHQKIMKTMKSEKDQLSEIIVKFMRTNNIENCNLDDAVLTIKTVGQLESVNKEYIHDKIMEFFKTGNVPSDAEQIALSTTEYLMNNRESTETFSLKLHKKK